MAELAHGRHTDRDAARGLQTLHGDGVVIGHVVLEHVGPEGKPHAFDGDHVLDRERHAVQRPERVASGGTVVPLDTEEFLVTVNGVVEDR